MISIQGFFLRTFLRLRKAGIGNDVSVKRLRARMEWGDRFVKLPEDVDFKSISSSELTLQWIIPAHAFPDSVILYIHGGGFTLGWSNVERRMLAQICQMTISRALTVDYRFAPEHPFPAALEDCVAAYRWLLQNGTLPQNILIAGASAGGNLTLTTLMALRDAGDPLPAAAVCISPITDLAGTGESLRTNHDPALTKTFALTTARYYANNQDLHLPLLSPHYGDLRGLPPLLIHVGEDEILLSDAMRLADNARNSGVDVSLVIWPKMWHVWHLFAPFLPEAQQAVNEASAFIRQHLNIS